jgi:hypothetical protein
MSLLMTGMPSLASEAWTPVAAGGQLHQLVPKPGQFLQLYDRSGATHASSRRPSQRII